MHKNLTSVVGANLGRVLEVLVFLSRQLLGVRNFALYWQYRCLTNHGSQGWACCADHHAPAEEIMSCWQGCIWNPAEHCIAWDTVCCCFLPKPGRWIPVPLHSVTLLSVAHSIFPWYSLNGLRMTSLHKGKKAHLGEFKSFVKSPGFVCLLLVILNGQCIWEISFKE